MFEVNEADWDFICYLADFCNDHWTDDSMQCVVSDITFINLEEQDNETITAKSY